MSRSAPPPPPSPARASKATLLLPAYKRMLSWLGTLSAVSLSALLGPLVLASLAWAAWAWTGTAGSLATALKMAAWALPANQQLRSAHVQGSLQHGGVIGQLEWQRDGLQVLARETQVVLDWSQLWRQAWPVRSLHLQALQLHDAGPAQAAKPWTSLVLPLPLQLDVQVDQFTWKGAADVALSDLKARYVFDGQTHLLDVQSLRLAQGLYSLQARLQGAAPMAVHIDVQGQVKAPTGHSASDLPLVLQTSVQGNLSGAAAELQLQTQLAPAVLANRSVRPQSGVRLDLQATMAPWASQPLLQAQGQWQALDLALLWPGAPQTQLQGQATLKPDGPAWQLEATLDNTLPGPWDQQRLPLSKLRLQARHAQGLWQIQQAQAHTGQGQVQALAQQTAAGWTGQIDLQNLAPAQLHTALTGPAVSGRLEAQAQAPAKDRSPMAAPQSIRLTANLSAQDLPSPNPLRPSNPATLAGLQWETLQLSGQWTEQTWDIDALRLQAAQALLEAQFKLTPSLRSVQGQMSLKLPGLQAQAQGSMAPQSGQGNLSVTVNNAAQSMAWLQALPGWGSSLQALKASGPGLLEAQWQGGFEQADAPLSLKVQWPRLAWQATPAQATQKPWVVTQGLLQLQGTPQAVQAQLQAHWGQGEPSAEVKTQWRAQRIDASNTRWQGQLESFQAQHLRTEPATTPPAFPWQLQLQQAMGWQAQLGNTAPSLEWAASAWQVQGPTPGTVQLQVEPGAWTAASADQAQKTFGAAQWQALPLSWAQHWLPPDIQSDVLLKGQVQWQIDQGLRLSLSTERSQGDVNVDTVQASGQRTAAGLRQAKVLLRIVNDKLEAELGWDSEHLGQLQAQLQSQLSPSAQSRWHWSEQAPLRGSVQARLPQVGAWSLLAPPGWRVQGTLDANLTLTGTRAQPQWQGRLQAKQLAARSAVQGIEFSQGEMQARLQGQTLVLERLSLRGAGTQGGELLASGQVHFSPDHAKAQSQVQNQNQNQNQNPGKPRNNPLSTAILALKIEAKGLRVSNRADRRLAISGEVNAQMVQGQLLLRGGLKADQALFILPDDSTPSLGDDVVVLGPGVGNFNLTDPRTATEGQDSTRSWLGVPDVQIKLDLGPDFRLQSKGLNTRLVGQLVLVSNTTTQGLPQITGQVRTQGGRYKAYGQQLNIETGVLRFDGPYDNPSLDVIALRPNLPQNVGVQITGTALLPRIRLYAEPDLPDADKLAWLVLGRPAASGGAESAVLQQAAVVLLSGNGENFSSELANRLGLDEISLATGSRSDSTATGAAVTLGKRLSKDFYLAYETSLSGAFGSLYIFYDLSRRLTLRAQAGEQSALDLIFTVRSD
ncbi:translocation/assembly module TamB domain-containing protein [Limnohabitans sp.]|uniref:translocation/assembly module TamB domain-containing protein n=1 Tax=Limnohabitans sp. TaxID=1907725 RepID=UPI0037C0354C